jgi:hypothetical protein
MRMTTSPPTAQRARACWGSLAAGLVLAACGGNGATPERPRSCVALQEEISWFRGAAHNDWNDVLIDSRQQVWLAGYADGTLGATTVDPSGNSRAVVRQLAPDGRLLWDSGATFDTAGTDVAEALALSAQGTLVVAGRTTGVLAGSSNGGQFDTFVAWSDDPASALPAWAWLQTGGPAPQRPLQVALAADGDVVVAGQDDLFVPSNFVAAWPDPFVLRLGRSGAPLRWQHALASVGSDMAGGLAVQADGTSFFSYTVDSGSQRGIHVRKLAADGRVLWTQRYSAQGLDHIAALRLRPDGSLWMAGTVFGSFNGGTPAGQQDVFVAQIDTAGGHVLGSWQLGTAQSEWLADMAIDAEGNVVLFGETLGSWVPGQPAAGAADLFLLRASPSGQALSVRQWGTTADEMARRVALDACGNAVAVGNSTLDGRRAGLVWFWRR